MDTEVDAAPVSIRALLVVLGEQLRGMCSKVCQSDHGVQFLLSIESGAFAQRVYVGDENRIPLVNGFHHLASILAHGNVIGEIKVSHMELCSTHRSVHEHANSCAAVIGRLVELSTDQPRCTSSLSVAGDTVLRKVIAAVPGTVFTLRSGSPNKIDYGGARPALIHALRDRNEGVSSPDDALIQARLAESRASMRPFAISYRTQVANLGMRRVRAFGTPEQDERGNVVWHGFALDITDTHSTSEALERAQRRWHLIAQGASLGLADLDITNGLCEFDDVACRLHGIAYPAEGFDLEAWYELFQSEDRSRLRAAVEAVRMGAERLEGVFRIPQTEGEPRLIELVGLVERGGEGQADRLIGCCRDLTDRARARRDREEQLRLVRESQKMLRFLSRLSHELRTPLNGILGSASLLLEGPESVTSAQRKRVETIEHCGRHLAVLVSDMMDLSRLHGGEDQLKPLALDVVPELQKALAVVDAIASRRKVSLSVKVDAATPQIHCDPRALHQVLLNLLSNAIKYNREGGSVEVEVLPSDGLVQISVADSGWGLSEEQIANLFEPFNRLGAEVSAVEGTGLGLVIVRCLCERMGGHLSVRSVPGLGSTFTVVLPSVNSLARKERK